MIGSSARPMYFGPADRPLFGVLHPAHGDRAPLGLVLCNPFGYEESCAHHALRQLAAEAASAGIPALRFDYDGTGDSAGDDFEPGRVDAWVGSIRQAAATLRARSGVRHVCYVGVRLGATLAAVAAADRSAVGLLAIAPVVRTRGYLRELKALQATSNRSEPNDPDAGGIESAGFVLTSETCARLGQLDLSPAAVAPPRWVMILDRDDLPSASGWAEQLRAAGASVDYRICPGYVAMMTSPHASVTPRQTFAAALEWVHGLARRLAEGEASSIADPAPVADERASGAPNDRVRLGGETPITESTLVLQSTARLFAVMSEPAERQRATAGRRGILLLNAGATHHIGPGRAYVTFARRRARRGDVVMRLDLGGIGESEPRVGEEERDIYSANAIRDVAVAVAALRERFGATEVIAVGLCSGAYHALKSAVAGQAIDGLVLINPLTFFWKPGMSLDGEFNDDEVILSSQRYRKSALRLQTWIRLLRGEVNVASALRVIVHRSTSIAASRARDIARRLGIALADDLAGELDSIVRRGVRVQFIFAAGDPGIKLLETQGGAAVRRLLRARRIGIEIIDGANHTFTSRAARTRLLDQIDRRLGALQHATA
jgi:predicted alpha/beta hydrolase